MNKPGVLILIHGVLSSPASWTNLVEYLQEDIYIKKFFDIELFTYPTPAYRLNPLKRIPNFSDIADRLTTALREDKKYRDKTCIVLVGHSQGGLIIQRFIADAVRNARASDELSRIRGVVLLATPNNGSELFLSARRALGMLIRHPQEKYLRPFNEQIAEVHSLILNRIIYTHRSSSTSHPIRFDVYTGDEDGVVPAHSARGMFPNVGTLPGDHSSIIRPIKSNDTIINALSDACYRAFNTTNPDATILRTEFLDPKNRKDVEETETLLGSNFLSYQNVSSEDFRYWLNNYEHTFGLPMRVLLARQDETIAGMLMFHESMADNMIVIDYIACRSEAEFQHIPFQKLVRQLRSRASSVGISSVVFELQNPSYLKGSEAARARARIRRFQSLGARCIVNLRYQAPNMDEFGSIAEESSYFLMHVSAGAQPETLSRSRVQKIVQFLYTVWYRNWFSRRFGASQNELDEYVDNIYRRVAGIDADLPDKMPLEYLDI
ncbi:esterase/lipase family protein [Methylobacterium oryzihabitans]|uniref:esterase/lipase family protein n=1 Tax=Methylobacterium oryzihabitans TaxID=2499852 RepID=UPI0016524CDD|nr:alpha/beta fold hydrolase [Methylobacterium oryzihabitans]